MNSIRIGLIPLFLLLLTMVNLLSAGTPATYSLDKVIGSSSSKGDYFGGSMDIDGKYLVVGATGADGSAPLTGLGYVFEKINGEWIEKQKLVASDAAMHAPTNFGWSVSISGDWIAVGDVGESTFGYGSGAVYLFQRGEDGCWYEYSKISGLDEIDASNYFLRFFGDSVSLVGNLLAVSSPGQVVDLANGGIGKGAVYIYKYTPSTDSWEMQDLVYPENPTQFIAGVPGEAFARSIAMSEDILLVGAAASVNTYGKGTGAVYKFKFSTTSQKWEQEGGRLMPSSNDSSINFGTSIAFNRRFIVVGSLGSLTSDFEKGAVYIFDQDELESNAIGATVSGPGTIITQGNFGITHESTKLVANEGFPFARFGTDVALSGNKILIGAPGAWNGSQAFDQALGSVYLFTHDPDTGWSQTKKFINETIPLASDLGQTVIFSGKTIIASEPREGVFNSAGSISIWNEN